MEYIFKGLQKFFNLSYKILKFLKKLSIKNIESNTSIILFKFLSCFIIFFVMIFFNITLIMAQDSGKQDVLENVQIEEKSYQKIKAVLNPEIEDIFLENISLSLVDVNLSENYGFDIFYFNFPYNRFFVNSSYSFFNYYDINFLYSDVKDNFYLTMFNNFKKFYFSNDSILDKIDLSAELLIDINTPLYFKANIKNYNFSYNFEDTAVNLNKSFNFKFFSIKLNSYYLFNSLFFKANNEFFYNYKYIFDYFNYETLYEYKPFFFVAFLKSYNFKDFIFGSGIKGNIAFNSNFNFSFYFYPVYHKSFDLIGKLSFNYVFKNLKILAFFQRKYDFNSYYFNLLPIFNYNSLIDNNIDVLDRVYKLNFSLEYILNNVSLSINTAYKYIENNIFLISDDTSKDTIFNTFSNLNNLDFEFQINFYLTEQITILVNSNLNFYFNSSKLITLFYNEPFKFSLTGCYDFKRIYSMLYFSYKTSLFRYDNIGVLNPLHIINIKYTFYGMDKILNNNSLLSFEINFPLVPVHYTRYFMLSNPEIKLNIKLFF